MAVRCRLISAVLRCQSCHPAYTHYTGECLSNLSILLQCVGDHSILMTEVRDLICSGIMPSKKISLSPGRRLIETLASIDDNRI